jgi:hypothetical protein
MVEALRKEVSTRRLRWAGHVARMEKRNAYSGKARGKDAVRKTKTRWMDMWDGVMWTGLVWLRIGTGGELL